MKAGTFPNYDFLSNKYGNEYFFTSRVHVEAAWYSIRLGDYFVHLLLPVFYFSFHLIFLVNTITLFYRDFPKDDILYKSNELEEG